MLKSFGDKILAVNILYAGENIMVFELHPFLKLGSASLIKSIPRNLSRYVSFCIV